MAVVSVDISHSDLLQTFCRSHRWAQPPAAAHQYWHHNSRGLFPRRTRSGMRTTARFLAPSCPISLAKVFSPAWSPEHLLPNAPFPTSSVTGVRPAWSQGSPRLLQLPPFYPSINHFSHLIAYFSWKIWTDTLLLKMFSVFQCCLCSSCNALLLFLPL